MNNTPFKPELLAPAGNFEKLEIAIHYGADAVYLAGKNFSLRNFSGNFTGSELKAGVRLAHHHGVKVYLACNIYSRNHEQKELETFLKRVKKIGPDAIIISDPGIVLMAKEIIPQIDIHLSTQANTTNRKAAEFWQSIGVKRVNLARELSLNEIKTIALDSKIETETFVHGAMCISYSGRCLLSNFLSGRDSNRGQCSHPCRWKYAVVEEQRPKEYHSLMEDEKGSYIFNSKDLCMIRHIPDLVDANITSLKIEGRMKGINYLASVVKTYRNAIDTYTASKETYKTDPDWIAELDQVFHREYCTGFYFGQQQEQLPNYHNIHQGKIHSFIGKIMDISPGKWHTVGIRNRLKADDIIEVLSAKGPPKKTRIIEMTGPDQKATDVVQPNMLAALRFEIECCPNDIVRKV